MEFGVEKQQTALNHRQTKSHVDLEHTELLADVGETLGLLGLVVDDVESHSLGKRSMH